MLSTGMLQTTFRIWKTFISEAAAFSSACSWRQGTCTAVLLAVWPSPAAAHAASEMAHAPSVDTRESHAQICCKVPTRSGRNASQ